MNVFTCNRVENCFSKTAIFQYQVHFKIDDRFLSRFEQVGIVKCHRNFPRPYFNITLPDGTAIKGILNDVVLKVIFPFEDAERSQKNFEQLLDSIVRKCQNVKE